MLQVVADNPPGKTCYHSPCIQSLPRCLAFPILLNMPHRSCFCLLSIFQRLVEISGLLLSPHLSFRLWGLRHFWNFRYWHFSGILGGRGNKSRWWIQCWPWSFFGFSFTIISSPRYGVQCPSVCLVSHIIGAGKHWPNELMICADRSFWNTITLVIDGITSLETVSGSLEMRAGC